MFAQSCDDLQKDVLDMLWNDMDFYKHITQNLEKFQIIYGNIELKALNGILENLKALYTEMDQVKSSLNDSTEIAVLTLKNYIESRVETITQNAVDNIDAP